MGELQQHTNFGQHSRTVDIGKGELSCSILTT